MKSVKLTISDGTPWGTRTFIIDECDGEPQIRHAKSAIASRDRSVEATMGSGMGPDSIAFSVSVESGE